MLTWFKWGFWGVLSLIVLAIIYKVSLTPLMVAPFPYKVTEIDETNWQEAREANVLILGDRMAETLDHYKNPLQDLSSQGLKEPLKIVNWASSHEGIHRTVKKLQFLSQRIELPEIIIYHGASREFYEWRVRNQDISPSLKNFQFYENDKVSSALILLPFLSRLLYIPVERLHLKIPIKEDKEKLSSGKRQKKLELIFKFFETHIQELIDITREHDNHLILTTTPVNLRVAPQQTCQNAMTQNIQESLDQVQEKLSSNRSKEAYRLAQKAVKDSISHAQANYLLGKSSYQSGNFKKAKAAWLRALSFDCNPNRISPIFNGIIRSFSNQREVSLIDFDHLVNQHMGRNVLFLNWLYPQHVYYQQFTKLLASEIRRLYDI